MRIPLFNTDIGYTVDAADDVIRSGWIGPGKKTQEFEEKLAEVVGVKHAIATTSGTTALMLSLIYEGAIYSNVSVPCYGMPAAGNVALLGSDRSVLLRDVDPETGNLPDASMAKDAQNKVVGIDHNGRPLGFRVDVEDACQGLGVRGCGMFGKVSCFSFSAQKIVTTGQGGAICTNDDEAAEKIRGMIDHGGGWRVTRMFSRPGGNFRFNDILAAIGLEQLRRLDQLVAQRMQVREWYRRRIPQIDQDDGWMVILRCDDAEGLVRHLNDRDIGAAQLYPPLCLHPLYKSRYQFPGAMAYHNSRVYLPSWIGLTLLQVDEICVAIERFLG